MCLTCRPHTPNPAAETPAETPDDVTIGERYIAEAVRVLDSLDASYTINELIATARFLEGNN